MPFHSGLFLCSFALGVLIYIGATLLTRPLGGIALCAVYLGPLFYMPLVCFFFHH
ncbi:hypothetical protein [Dictyobacter kobayashii]|uniref:Uncharacterized protein n=1 Tax=Dictyobacter kobayashii TaxID=2014872 RepID=A0A402APB7_9CHLR|nr:hypothetical protein [Dictyobacter kobayashii]GCE20956.1 hypothetical protein KDK_47560 [Dictyobacter kobayashii]